MTTHFKKSAAILFFAIALISQAQSSKNYNRWSLELNGGFSNFNKDFQTQDYFTNHFNLGHGDLGIRYMFNPVLGLKADVGYDLIKAGEIDGVKSKSLDGSFSRASLQGVVNVSNLISIRNFTKKFGLLLHAGAGFSTMTLEEPNPLPILTGYNQDEDDDMIGVVYGGTLQYKLSKRIVLTGDLTTVKNFYGRSRLDGNYQDMIYLDKNVTNLSLGLTLYLGKRKEHMDWLKATNKDVEEKVMQEVKDYDDEINSLENRLKALEAIKPKDYEDRIKELENKLNSVPAPNQPIDNTAKDLMDENLIHAYFDFDKDMPKPQSIRDMHVVITYLKKNPTAKLDLVGYTDNVGTESYNNDLSRRRAENVKKILVNSGVDANRLTIKYEGIKDTNLQTEEEKALARKVVFRVK